MILELVNLVREPGTPPLGSARPAQRVSAFAQDTQHPVQVAVETPESEVSPEMELPSSNVQVVAAAPESMPELAATLAAAEPDTTRQEPTASAPASLVYDAEFAANAYAEFGADDCPETAECYAFGDIGELKDAAIDPPPTWSDSLFLNAEPSLRQYFSRGLIGSAYAYAQATGKNDRGRLQAAEVRSALEKRRMPSWILDQLCDMALAGAPINPSVGLGTRLSWRAHRSEILTAVAGVFRTRLGSGLSHIILTPWLDSGGAERVALWHAQATVDAGKGCLVIGTDGRKEGWIDRLPRGARYLSLQGVLEESGHLGQVNTEEQSIALAIALAQTNFDVLHVINSYVGTLALRNPIDWGKRRVFYSLFGIGLDQHGLEAGYWLEARQVRGVRSFLSDNALLPRQRASSFGLSVDQFTPIAYPVELTRKYAGGRAWEAPTRRILWASRFDVEKQPRLVFEIARHMPDVEFHMFGRSLLGDDVFTDAPDNVHLRGAFDGWESLPSEPFDGFLFTSKWEGLPNILLEAMASGLPVVASAVGAVPEAVGEHGWLVEDVTNPEGYVTALEHLLGDPDEAGRRAARALEVMSQERTLDAFKARLTEIGYL